LNEAMMTVILQAYNSFTGVDGIQWKSQWLCTPKCGTNLLILEDNVGKCDIDRRIYLAR
jgi:hypothetical protein